MCCLFGLLDYKQQLSLEKRKNILRVLSIVCEERGTDATGIAYFNGSRMYIQKAPRAAHRMRFHISQNARFVMGHTRMATQGDQMKNYNNHPFTGNVGKLGFALAHNGVLYNDSSLRVSQRLPSTMIETDSYVAVQLIEKEKSLGFESLRKMAEALRGSFTFTVLDTKNDLYIVKGNNPMCIYQYEEAGFYLYASTQEILETAVQLLNLDTEPHKRVKICSGEMLRIAADGSKEWNSFNDVALWDKPIYSLWGGSTYSPKSYLRDEEKSWRSETLKLYSQISGYDVELLKMLYDAGFSILDIEQMVYDPELMDECIAELRCDSFQ